MTTTGALFPSCGPRSCGPQGPNSWYMYVLRCNDSSLYCGIARNPQARLKQHNARKGSKYVKGRLPAWLAHTEFHTSKGDALRAEAAFKKLPKNKKEKIVGGAR